jgi:hypothetical protein
VPFIAALRLLFDASQLTRDCASALRSRGLLRVIRSGIELPFRALDTGLGCARQRTGAASFAAHAASASLVDRIGSLRRPRAQSSASPQR